MKKLNIATLLCGLILFITSCGGSTTATSVDEVETTAKLVAEGEVAIGSQVWTSKNLDVTKYRNGDVIPEVQDKKVWGKLTTGAWCYNENKTGKGSTYGKLYNWYAVNDPRGLAPKGYHIPSDAEWTILIPETILGDEVSTKMKSTSGWDDDGNGTNESGFAGLPSGSRDINGDFSFVGAYGLWWCSSEDGASHAWARFFYGSSGNVNRNFRFPKQYGLSVRCLRD